MKLPSCYLAVEVICKDGYITEVSPILNANENISIWDDCIEVQNNKRNYTFDKDNIEQLNIIAIFNDCVVAREKIY